MATLEWKKRTVRGSIKVRDGWGSPGQAQISAGRSRDPNS